MTKNGQVSMEYLLIVGFILLITIPMVFIFMLYSSESQYTLESNQIDQVAKQVADAADSVFYLGEPSQTTIKVYIPTMIEEAILDGREVIFKIKKENKTSDIVAISAVNMTGFLPTTKGVHFITIKAIPNAVNITTN